MEKFTVWCGFRVQSVIGPYFFEDEHGKRVTVDGERYRSLLTEYFELELVNVDVGRSFHGRSFSVDRSSPGELFPNLVTITGPEVVRFYFVITRISHKRYTLLLSRTFNA